MSDEQKKAKLWGGRFHGQASRAAEDFNSSIAVDQRLAADDIRGSRSHARMLGARGIISAADAAAIDAGLSAIAAELEAGTLAIDMEAEDIHTFIEQELTRRIGAAGGRLHTARSRNDQIATDLRLYLRREIGGLEAQLRELIAVLLRIAEQHTLTVLPGYTHLQKAQPLSLAHHLLAYAQMLRRDCGRFADTAARMNSCPLGSGALAGTPFDIDREATALELGFDLPCANSLDGVSDRDFALEFLAACSITMMHFSRLCEELILWNSPDFGYISIDDAYATGSSIMPQKKNPDMAELIRGKTGRVYGDLLALLTTMKGLPLAYNKDMQEDKAAVFDALDTLKACAGILAPMLATIAVDERRMRDSAAGGFINATDLADYLVGKGMPFRDAHSVSGQCVAYAEGKGCALSELSLDEYRRFSPLIGDDVFAAIDLAQCLSARDSAGGPAPRAVEAALEELRRWLEKQPAGVKV
ncbi:MAG: argininosuccinate lyase [Bacillota bacterium]|nr:argininosuccinate lyase [Bacillota bacterium]